MFIFCRLKINHESQEFILDPGTVANKYFNFHGDKFENFALIDKMTNYDNLKLCFFLQKLNKDFRICSYICMGKSVSSKYLPFLVNPFEAVASVLKP